MHLRGRALLALFLSIVCAVAATGQDARPRVPETLRLQAAAGRRVRVIVGLREATTPEGRLTAIEVGRQRARIRARADDLLARLQPRGVSRARRFATIPFFAAEVDAAALRQLEGDPDVASIEEDVVARPTLAQSVPLVGAPAVWQEGVTGAGWTVAVLDTGVDATHPFLAGRIASEACYSNAAGAGGGFALCPGGTTSSLASGSALNCSAAYSGCDHGTHVAGIVAGRGASFSGVAPDAGIVAIQVFTGFDAATCGGAACVGSFASDQILGLERVLALKDTFRIAAVNLSLGGSQIYTDTATCDAANTSRKAAIDNLRSSGIATVVAAGNAGVSTGLSAPACISSAVSVGSTTKNDAISSFSNAAPFLSLLAPGSSITSSVPGGGFAAFSGTSMAAPHVTGAWALMKSLAPAASVDAVLNALRGTGLSIADTRVTSPPSYPRIRVDAAIALVAISEVQIDAPAANAHVSPPFAIAGWALSRVAPSGTGVDAVHVYAFDAQGAAAFLGVAPYGSARDDVASVFGSHFRGSGFYLPVRGLPPGAYQLVAYAHNAITGSFDAWAVRPVVVDLPVSRPLAAIDTPGPGDTVGPTFTIAGWSLDLAASIGFGVDAIHAYAMPAAGGNPFFIGAAYGGVRRDDVAAAFGAPFRDSGYAMQVTLAPGAYTLIVYARSTVTGTWTAQTRAIAVRAPGLPVMNVDLPVNGATGTQLPLAGWAADLDAATGSGVDVVHVWAIAPSGAGTFVGATTTGGQRDDVGGAFGSQFATAGFTMMVSGLAPGTYQLIVYAHSTVTNTFSQWRVVTVTIAAGP